MIEIHIYNSRSYIVGQFDPDYYKNANINNALRKELSYRVENAEFSSKYKTGKWDGRISLYYLKDKSFPSGLIYRVRQFLQENEIPYKLVDKRIKKPKNLQLSCAFEENGKQLRFYQEQAVKEALKKTRGIISAGTGAGKTFIAIKLIAEINSGPYLFVVPSRELLKQTHREFTKYLRNNGSTMKIGMIGDGICEIEKDGINIITYQSALASYNEKFDAKKNQIVQSEFVGERIRKPTKQLENEYNSKQILYDRKAKYLNNICNTTKDFNKAIRKEKNALIKAKNAYMSRIEALNNKKEIRELIENTNCLIVDETHIAAVIIEKISMRAKNAYYKFGVSATPFRTDNQEIRMEGALGRIFYKISASDLIELGYLVQPKIFIVKYKNNVPTTYEENGVTISKKYMDIYKECIVHSDIRNNMIKQYAETFHKMGRPTLILVDLIEHGETLENMIEDAIFVPGSAKSHKDEEDLMPTDEDLDYRRRMLNRVEANDIILIATSWANTGIDAPLISTLILGSSSGSPVTTMQQIGRILRTAPGKEDAIIIDFFDNQKYLRTHSLHRKKIYQLEPKYQVIEIS